MLLTIAIVTGLIGGLIRAFLMKQPVVIPNLRAAWMVPAAFLPQALCFYIPATSTRIPDSITSILLVASQLMLLVFTWLNLNQRGFLALGLGTLLNVLVITANGGWMPISPETLACLHGDAPQMTWVIGERLGVSKDIVLPYANMIFPLLSDRIILPPLLSQGLAYSLGDIFIALGAFQLLFSISWITLHREKEAYP